MSSQIRQLEGKIDGVANMTGSSVSAAYNRRASTYDADTTFHWRLAQEYIEYVKPKAGESLLDLACGTGLVTFALAPHLKKVKDDEEKPLIVGVDIADGMLERAVFKLGHEENSGLEIEFLKGDITRLDEVEELSDMGGAFDIITVCSALVLLDYPKEAIKHWAKYLKPGGRLVLDVPHPMAMLGVKVLGKIARDFGIPTLGNREWVHNLDSLKEELEDAGLDAEVQQTKKWHDVPSRTKYKGWNYEEGVWHSEDGANVFDFVTKDNEAWGTLKDCDRENARASFVREWRDLAEEDNSVREVNGLFIGVGVKR